MKTMNPDLLLMAFLLALIIIGETLLIRNRIRRIRYFAHLYKVELTQSYFAKARNKLMDYALSNKIDVHSVTFRKLYELTTAFLRRPDQYNELSLILGVSLFETGKSENSFPIEERKQWNKETGEVLTLAGNAIGHIVVEYSRPYLLLKKLLKLFDKRISNLDTIEVLKWGSKKLKADYERDQKIKNVQNSLYYNARLAT